MLSEAFFVIFKHCNLLDFSFIQSVSNYHGNFHKKEVDQNIIIGSGAGRVIFSVVSGHKGTHYLFDRPLKENEVIF